MGTWIYRRGDDPTPATVCEDAFGMELSVGSCDGEHAHVVVRDEPEGRNIGSIHVPRRVIPEFVWSLICYSGTDLGDVIDFLQQQEQG